MIKCNELKSSIYTTTYYKSDSIHDDKSAVTWFCHMLEMKCFDDMFAVYVGRDWTNNLESRGRKFTPESSTPSRLKNCIAETSPRFIEVAVDFDGIRCKVGVDLYRCMAYITMRRNDIPDLPWLEKVLPG